MIQKISDLIYEYAFFFFPAGESHPYDYIAHFTVSFVGVILLFLMIRLPGINLGLSFKISFLSAVGIMIFVGIVKEISDANIGKTDMTFDLIANGLGIILAITIMLIIKALWR